MTFECVEDARAVLGEGPVWDAGRGCLWWVDIKAPALMAFDPAAGASRRHALPGQVGCLGLASGGRLVLALEDGLRLLDPGTDAMERLGTLAPEEGTVRFNDGKVDPAGRFWVGSLDDAAGFPPHGKLYRVEPDGRHAARREGLHCPNGIGWTADGARMLHTDSTRRTIWSYDFDPATGAMESEAVFAEIEGPAVPDGLAVDAEGCVWSAQWDGGCVARFDPSGTLMERIAVPVPRPTSCAFGGPDLRTLYVTSASVELSDAALADAPLSGGLFAMQTDVSGVPVGTFGEGATPG